MKKKIVIKVQINCEKCRKMAMKVASAAVGVDSVAVQGESRDLLVVIGDQVDPVCLTTALRKKLSHAALVSVEEVKPLEEEQGGKKKPEEEVHNGKVDPPAPYQVVPICHHGPALVAVHEYYCEPDPNSCSIL